MRRKRRIRGGLTRIAAAALTSVYLGVQPAFGQTTAELPLPSSITGLPRRTRMRVLRKGVARLRNEDARRARRGARGRWFRSLGDERKGRRKLVERMTNWQRNQWARAGYPQDLKVIRSFVEKGRGRAA